MSGDGTAAGGIPARFHALDVVRGLAALTVVLCHWKHFFYIGTTMGGTAAGEQPLHALLGPLYEVGGRAVHLFYALSGFIFWWLYAERIRARDTSAWEFAVLRFSRLYPLHLVTLVGVALAQWGMLRWQGSYFVFPSNDAYHFVLQLFLASQWGFEGGFSFNGPIWSVSVEVFLYAVFFTLARWGVRRWWQVCLVVLGGVPFLFVGHTPRLGVGILAFFSGALAFKALEALVAAGRASAALRWVAASALLLWIVIPLNERHRYLEQFYRTHPWREGLHVGGRDVGGILLGLVSGYAVEVVLFPVSILTLALAEVRWRSMARRLSFLGDISYSCYLLHFPLQMAFFAAFAGGDPGRAFFKGPTSLVLFLGLLIPLCLLSYHRLERPSQSWIRTRLLGPPASRGRRHSAGLPG